MSVNPTMFDSWKELRNLSQNVSINTSVSDYQYQLDGLSFDFSKNLINPRVLSALFDLARECNLIDNRNAYYKGDIINHTEKRAVLHTALRNQEHVDCTEIKSAIEDSHLQIKKLCDEVISGKWKGYSGKSISTIVNIGIGGSDLGPKMVVKSLSKYRNHLDYHYVSTIDADYLEVLNSKLDLETTLFIIVSKTFTTIETLSIAEFLLKPYKDQGIDYSNNVIAVSASVDKVKSFGIKEKNIFPVWNWVGGRFSLWSSVGISIALLLGYDNYKELLDGAAIMDDHFYKTDLEENIPVLGALLSIWYSNFLGCQSEGIIAYSAFLELLVPYLQQVFMESNGKHIDKNGESIDYTTGNILWGGIGTEAQHAFMQLIHQGTFTVPLEFIGVKNNLSGNEKLQKILNANLKGQIDALYKGRMLDEVDASVPDYIKPFKTFEGGKPTTCIMMEKLNPQNLGSLLAYYEHRVFVQGIIWNINSYDQFGVELGKELAKKLL